MSVNDPPTYCKVDYTRSHFLTPTQVDQPTVSLVKQLSSWHNPYTDQSMLKYVDYINWSGRSWERESRGKAWSGRGGMREESGREGMRKCGDVELVCMVTYFRHARPASVNCADYLLSIVSAITATDRSWLHALFTCKYGLFGICTTVFSLFGQLCNCPATTQMFNTQASYISYNAALRRWGFVHGVGG